MGARSSEFDGFTGDLPLLEQRLRDGKDLPRYRPPSPPPSMPPLPPGTPPEWKLHDPFRMGQTPLDKFVAQLMELYETKHVLTRSG